MTKACFFTTLMPSFLQFLKIEDIISNHKHYVGLFAHVCLKKRCGFQNHMCKFFNNFSLNSTRFSISFPHSYKEKVYIYQTFYLMGEGLGEKLNLPVWHVCLHENLTMWRLGEAKYTYNYTCKVQCSYQGIVFRILGSITMKNLT